MDNCPTYLDPKTLSELKDLRLRASTIVDGLVTGTHRSPFQGNSVEFSQHREYVPGDDIRHVDWKVFARTDKYHLKQYEDETNLRCWLMIDQSSSMQFRSPESDLSKYDYACCLAVTLAWLVLNQRDAVALATFSSQLNRLIRPSDQTENLHSMIEVLGQTGSNLRTSTTDLKSSLSELALEAKNRGVIIVLTDAFDELSSLTEGLEKLRQRKHQVILIQVCDPRESDLALNYPLQLKGMENQSSYLVDPISLRKAYREVVTEHTEQISRLCLKQNVDYHRFHTDLNLGTAVSQVLFSSMRS